MDERFEKLAKGLAKMGAVPGEDSKPSLDDLERAAGDVITDNTITYAKMVCLDQKKRGGSLSDARAFIDAWQEAFGRVNFYGASLSEMKALVEQYWDSVTCPDPDVETKYYEMVARLYY